MNDGHISFTPLTRDLFKAQHANLDAVARERKYLVFLKAPPFEESAKFFEGFLCNEGCMLLAMDGEVPVGWCDVRLRGFEGQRHCGTMGLGLLPDYRSRGIGRRLMESTIEAAVKKLEGMERIELYVFASNVRAHCLYLNLGFVEEGRKLRARKLDGVYDDEILMVKWVWPDSPSF